MDTITNCSDCKYEMKYDPQRAHLGNFTCKVAVYCPHCGTKNNLTLTGVFFEPLTIQEQVNDSYRNE